MSNLNYLAILKKAWNTTWDNKYLWWFGFFIALTSTGSFFNYSTNRGGSAEWFNQQFSTFVAAHSGLITVGIFAAILLIVFFLVMRILSRGALITSIEKSLKNEKLGFSLGIKVGKKYFWRIFLISFLIQLAIGAIAFLIATPIAFLFMTHSYVLASLLTMAGVIIIIPLLILSFFLENYGTIYAVLGDLSLIDAIENAYNLFRKNISSSIVMALIFIPIAIILGVSALFLLFFLGIIFFVIGLVFFFIFNKVGAAIILILAALTFLIIFLGARSIYETFYQAAWIFFFHEIASPKVEEKITETDPAEIKPVTDATPDPITFLGK